MPTAHPYPRWLSRRSLQLAACLSVGTATAQEVKLTYEDHIRPVLENKCFSCHNPDKKKGGLELTSYSGLMNGGSGGAVVEPGNPAASRLWTYSAHKEEPYMPPEGAPLEAKDLNLLAKWITDGVVEAKGGVARKAGKPKVDLTFAGGAGKPSGPAARPQNVLLEPVVVTARTNAITALAASPWTPLLAVAGQKQILLYDTDTRELAGILPYPEGYARSLKFSANGSLLIMGGGRGGKLGHAVIWDVATGRRVAEVGKEFDQAMSADITPDHRKVVLGTNAKKVKCFDLSSGELLYTIAKHTEWITAVDFSPDGVLLASADRNGNVMVWEADNGGEFYNLGQHKGAVTDLAWRPDSNVLASCSVDGVVTTWELKTGKQLASWSCNGAVQSVSFTPDGKIITAGNGHRTEVWTINGQRIKQETDVYQDDIISKVVAMSDGKTYATGNWLGEVRLFDVASGRDISRLSSNPPKLADQIAGAAVRLPEIDKALPAAQASLKSAEAKGVAADAELARARLEGAPAAQKLTAIEAKQAEVQKGLDYWQGQLSLAKTPEAKAKAEKALADCRTGLAYHVSEAAKVQPAATPYRSAEVAVAKAKTELITAQAAVRDLEAEAAAIRERVSLLKAAQFNVGVITEREKLVKLEADLADLVAAQAENEAAKLTAAGRIAPARQAAAALGEKIQAQEKVLVGLQESLAALDRTLTPLRQQEAEAAGKLELQGKRLKEAQEGVVTLGRERDVAVAAGQAALAEYRRNTPSTRLPLAEATARVDEFTKQIEALQAKLVAQQAVVTAILAAREAAAQALATLTAERQAALAASQAAEATLVTAQGEFTAARTFKAIFSTSYFSRRKATTAQLAAAQDGLIFTRNRAESLALYGRQAEQVLAAAQSEQANALAGRATLTAQQDGLVKNRAPAIIERDALAVRRLAAQKQAALLQAAIDDAEKVYQTKLPAAQALVAKEQGVYAPLEQALSGVRVKFAEAAKPLEAQRLVAAAAAKELAGYRQQQLAAEKMANDAEKEIPQRAKALEEIALARAEALPQVEPLKARVKAVQAEYLAMLPKREVAKKN